MNPIKQFFQEDIPATFSSGKWRINLVQLKNQISQLEKQKNAALNDLGVKAWGNRVDDVRYGTIYGKLESLDYSFAQAQQEINSQQYIIDQENTQLRSTIADFDNRLAETQSQRQVAAQKLAQVQTAQQNIEQRLNQCQTIVSKGPVNIQNMQMQIAQLQTSGLVDKEARIASLQSSIESVKKQVSDVIGQIEFVKGELESNLEEQKPIKSEVEEFDQQIKNLQVQKKNAMAAIQERLKSLQQDLLKGNNKKNDALKQIAETMPEFGKQVYLFRPPVDVLTAPYSKVDAIQNEIVRVSDQINLTQARLASVSSKSLLRVGVAVGLATGFIVFMIVSIVIFAKYVVPSVAKSLQPDANRDIRLVESWTTFQECSAPQAGINRFSDISIWENKRNDYFASVETEGKLIGANSIILDTENDTFSIAPGGKMISGVSLDSKGSRV